MVSLEDKVMLAASYEGYSILNNRRKMGKACEYWTRAREKAGIREATADVLQILIGAESLKERGVLTDVSYECDSSPRANQVRIKPKTDPWMLDRYIRYRPKLGSALIVFETREAEEQERVSYYIR